MRGNVLYNQNQIDNFHLKHLFYEEIHSLCHFCIALLPVLLFRDFTPDNELRYLSIADEAIRSNTFFTFTNHGIPYADKPPLYLWIVMLGKWLFGSHQMWFLALASLIPSLVVVDVLDRWCGSKLDGRGRLSARLMLLTSALFAGMAVTLRMDMLMCMFIVLALRSFYRLYRSGQDGHMLTAVRRRRDGCFRFTYSWPYSARVLSAYCCHCCHLSSFWCIRRT